MVPKYPSLNRVNPIRPEGGGSNDQIHSCHSGYVYTVPDRASVHTRNAALEAVSALEQYCSAPLLKVERSFIR